MTIPENGRQRRKKNGGDVFNIGSIRPFRMYAEKYLEAGWHPIPLPAGKKYPPPVHYTGRHDNNADRNQLDLWAKERGRDGCLVYDERANLGFRVPKGVLGIDVDDYPGKAGKERKQGGASLRALAEELGSLPDTWISTARSDGISGIRWFRVPEELVWPGKLGVDIESVWYRYRFSVAPPSLHPELKEPYLWYAPGGLPGDGSGTTAAIPNPAELPELPAAWVEALQTGLWAAKAYDFDSSRNDLKDWIKARPAGKAEEGQIPVPCPRMRKAAEDAIEEISGAGSAHQSLNQELYYLLNLAAEGHLGIIQALQKVRETFIAEVTDKNRAGSARVRGEAEKEYDRSRDGAVREILGTLKEEAKARGLKGAVKLPEECGCYIPVDGYYGFELVNIDPEDYDKNDRGNAEQLADFNPGQIHWVPALDTWVAWDGVACNWIVGPLAHQFAMDVGKRIQKAAQHKIKVAFKEAEKDAQQEGADEAEAEKRAAADEDVKAAKALYKWGLDSGNKNRISSMMELAKKLPGIEISASLLDSDTEVLATPDGVVDLCTKEICAPEPEMYITKQTRFSPRAVRRSAWEKFLRVSLPDRDVREYLQKLAGYSLYGHNKDRIFVFLVGPTGSGKSIFVETIARVLGDYAGPFPLSLFRDNQDDKHRSDIVAALPRRFIGTAEASRSWSLHADQVKRITGGDTISARAPYGKGAVERVPAFTPWISSNETPAISGIDAALTRRLRVARFPRTVVGTRDDVPGLKEVLCRGIDEGGCGEVVVDWLLGGAVRYAQEGLDDVPVSMLQETMDFVTEATGHLGEWFEDTFVVEQNEYVATAEISSSYEMYCAEYGVRDKDRVSSTKLGIFLTERGIGRAVQKKYDGKNQKVRPGLAWRKEPANGID